MIALELSLACMYVPGIGFSLPGLHSRGFTNSHLNRPSLVYSMLEMEPKHSSQLNCIPSPLAAVLSLGLSHPFTGLHARYLVTIHSSKIS